MFHLWAKTPEDCERDLNKFNLGVLNSAILLSIDSWGVFLPHSEILNGKRKQRFEMARN